MSYAVRNTLVLSIVLLLFAGGGGSYLYLGQAATISEMESELQAKQQQLTEKQQIASRYAVVLEQYEEATYFFNNYEKALYLEQNEDRVFDFLTRLNRGSSYTDFTFSFIDSTSYGQYGIMNMNISGEGYYRNLMNFIRRIEYSKPLNKLTNLSITPINTLENYGKVTYSFSLASYYDRAKLLEQPSFDIANITASSLYNPFYPLIRDVQPNEEGLINVEQSNLLALSADKVFLIDQSGMMHNLRPGDEVYLGSLTSIDLRQGTATFTLNKGGIIELVTLALEAENENQ